MLRPGTLPEEIARTVENVAGHFGVRPLVDICCSQVHQWINEGNETIASVAQHPQTETEPIAVHQAWCVRIAMTTAPETSTAERDVTPGLFVRDMTVDRSMRAPSAVKVANKTKEHVFPFTDRFFELSPANARLGISQCRQFGLIQAMPVLFVPVGHVAVEVGSTILVTATNTERITQIAAPAAASEADATMPAELVALLARPTRRRQRKDASM
eukprot:gnl/Ergobibamus_cyprinoides/199.p3 GENE.gnl/Ergobibamus_cyprinoides/199~~gnl/Ergobibamus_cyprinoides/199.p3  ORF type:complete len:214 (+),score=74.63 gnl/Ergobibamus_cyprinoides/199:487-1128(+)